MVDACPVRGGMALGLGLVGVLLVGAPVGLWLSIQLDDAPLHGVLVGGEPLSRAGTGLPSALEARAELWAQREVVVRIGEASVRRRRDSLGAQLLVPPMVAELQRVGRSGNPVVDLGKWWTARRGMLDLRWSPVIDAARLGGFVEREQAQVEWPPMAGITDGQGWSLPGSDGRALDHAAALATLRRALATHATEVRLELQRVPAPPPIPIGSPDGVLFASADPGAAATDGHTQSRRDTGSPRTPHAPARWMPTREQDCHDEPRPFCDGPRRVPAPHGAAEQLAQQLGLGQLNTVGHLVNYAPKPDWIAAAMGHAPRRALLWPVTTGKLGRGFGYVRRDELRHRLHKGIDIVASSGSPVRAVGDGIVAYSDNRVRGYGNLLVIVHADGGVTFNAHCQQIFVFAGERVERGQVVAEVGMTGLAMGPHLHFEYHRGGEPVDPQPYFEHGSP